MGTGPASAGFVVLVRLLIYTFTTHARRKRPMPQLSPAEPVLGDDGVVYYMGVPIGTHKTVRIADVPKRSHRAALRAGFGVEYDPRRGWRIHFHRVMPQSLVMIAKPRSARPRSSRPRVLRPATAGGRGSPSHLGDDPDGDDDHHVEEDPHGSRP
jgi:hypothetical protein